MNCYETVNKRKRAKFNCSQYFSLTTKTIIINTLTILTYFYTVIFFGNFVYNIYKFWHAISHKLNNFISNFVFYTLMINTRTYII